MGNVVFFFFPKQAINPVGSRLQILTGLLWVVVSVSSVSKQASAVLFGCVLSVGLPVSILAG